MDHRSNTNKIKQELISKTFSQRSQEFEVMCVVAALKNLKNVS